MPHSLLAEARSKATSVLDYSNAKTEHASAIQMWRAALSDALSKLRRFDLLVGNVLKDNSIVLSEDASARTISKPAGRKAAPAETAPAEGNSVAATAVA